MQSLTSVTLRSARRDEASAIARLIMVAMNHECCQNFAGPDHSLADFHRMMTGLVEMERSQYSHRNTIVAEVGGELAGIVVSYDGGDLLSLREAFIRAARCHLGRDFSDMDEETRAGEHYVDSLAVVEHCRHQGIASRLLRAVIERHGDRQPIGLLVDQGNPAAEKMYRRVGFDVVGETEWGGHPMRHMQWRRERQDGHGGE